MVVESMILDRVLNESSLFVMYLIFDKFYMTRKLVDKLNTNEDGAKIRQLEISNMLKKALDLP